MDWSNRWKNLAVDQRDIYTGYQSVIATVSEEQGLEKISIYPYAIDSEMFVEHLKWLREKHGDQPLAIYCDSLSVHKSKETKPFWDKLDIKRVFNVGYSPEFNPIEACFS